jgi:pimeloyl-ACP methyl ester carboxylesterase
MTSILVALALLALLIAGLVAFTAWTARRIETALPPRGRFLEVDGARLHYLDKGQGPAVVMIHGLGGQMGHFTCALLDRLAGEFRVVLIDRPGSGHSTRPPGASAALRTQAGAIAKAIRALRLERPLVVGHSLGGAVALALALDHPDCVGALALIAPLTQEQQEVPPQFRGLAIRSAALRRIVAWTLATPMGIRRGREILASVFAPDVPPDDFPVRAGGLLGLRPGSFYATSSDMVAANDDLPGMATRYPKLTVPVAVLYGTEDRVLDPQRHGGGLKQALPSAELSLVPGGHMLPISAPEVTAEWIKAVARKLAGQGGDTAAPAGPVPHATA